MPAPINTFQPKIFNSSFSVFEDNVELRPTKVLNGTEVNSLRLGQAPAGNWNSTRVSYVAVGIWAVICCLPRCMEAGLLRRNRDWGWVYPGREGAVLGLCSQWVAAELARSDGFGMNFNGGAGFVAGYVGGVGVGWEGRKALIVTC